MSKNYLKLFEDGTSEAVDVKPSWGMYEKEHALDNREVYIDGNWYSTTGGELLSGGTFDSDITGWTAENGTTLSLVSNTIKILSPSGNAAYASFVLPSLVVGETYKVDFSIVAYGGTAGRNRGVQLRGIDGTYYGALANSTSLGDFSTYFTAQDSELEIWLVVDAISAGDYSQIDNISVFKAEPTIDTLQPPHTYLSNKGKLAGIEVANGIPVDIHYDELAPTLVEDTIKATDIIAGEYHGKNACTGFVRFNGVAPIDILSNFNIDSIVRTAIGRWTINCSNLTTTEYSVTDSSSGGAGSGGGLYVTAYNIGSFNVIKLNSSGAYEDTANINLHIFGGTA